jgi:hypothetical protein
MSWHWESYVHKNNLWSHFGRFSEAIKGIDPVHESFTTSFEETDSLRIYTLNGKYTTLVWVRDKNNNWKTELDENIEPKILHGYSIKLPEVKKGRISVYDPWKNTRTTLKMKNKKITFPDFTRSIVLRYKN